jgi:hypothetical protein
MAFYLWTRTFGVFKKARQNPKNLAVLPKVNNRKRPKIFKKVPIFYAPQKYSNICRPPKIGHTKKPLKITQNHAKLSQEHSKKMAFYF